MLPRVAARRAAALATSSAMTAAPRGGAARRALADAAPKKDVPPPPPPPPSGGGGGGAVWFALAALAAGGAYVFQDSIKAALGGDSSSKPKEEKPKAPAAAPAPAPTPAPAAAVAPKPAAAPTPAPAPATTKKEVDQLETRLKTAEAVAKGTPPPVDWNKVRARVVDLLDDEQYDDGSWGPVFVRLAWHAAGTYDNKTKRGGSEGAYMRFADEAGWGANAGLALPRARLEALKKEFPGASFADLWSFAGTVAIEEMGGPKMNWRPGRKDAAAPLAPALPGGLLPDADGRDKKEKPADHLRDIFYRMGFNDREIVALSGGHALGRCHTDRSGFWGPWTRAPTTFSNEYYRLLLEEKWTPKKTHKGQAWTGPAQFEDKTGDLMMLPTDLALVQDPKMRPIVEQYAKDEKAFFNDFAKAWIKLQELGVPALQKPWWKVWYQSTILA